MTESLAVGDPATPAAIARQSSLGGHLLLRWVGAWIDLIVLALFLIAPAYLLGDETYQATIVVWLGLVILYFPVCEAFWGRTLGKLATGLVIVDRDGRPPGILKALLRTLLRLIEVNPFIAGGIPAAIAVACSKHRQRLGDMAAGTYVVPARELAKVQIGSM